MLIHNYDPITKLYLSSQELETLPESATAQPLPEMTEDYTLAFIDGVWVTVLRPNRQIVNNQIVVVEG